MDMTLIPFADINIGNQHGYVKYNITFDKLRMRKILCGIEKSLMLSLSKHARRLSHFFVEVELSTSR